MTVLAASEQVLKLRSLLFLLLSCGLSLLLLFGGMLLLWFLRRIGSSFSVVGGCCRVRSCSLLRIFCTKSRHQCSPFFFSKQCHRNLFFRTLDRCCSTDCCLQHQRLLRVPSSGPATDGHLDFLSSCTLDISKNTVASHWSGPPSKTLSDLRVRFHLNRFHPTSVSTLGLFPEPSLKLQEWQI